MEFNYCNVTNLITNYGLDGLEFNIGTNEAFLITIIILVIIIINLVVAFIIFCYVVKRTGRDSEINVSSMETNYKDMEDRKALI